MSIEEQFSASFNQNNYAMKKTLLSIFTLLSFCLQAQLDSTSFRVRPNSQTTLKQYVSVPITPSLQLNGNFTLECWVFVPAFGAQQQYLIETYTGGAGGYVLRLNFGNIMAYAMGASSPSTTGTGLVAPNQWNHVAATFDDTSNEMKLYLNGVLDQTATLTVDNSCNTSVLNIGARGDDTNVNDPIFIDDVRIWNTVRSENEIAANLEACLIGNESGLVLYYDFEDLNTNGIVLDKTANGNNGTVIGNIDPIYDGAFACCVIDNEVTLNNETLTATQSGTNYQWIDCTSGNTIIGATNQTFTASTNGNYACIIDNGSCSDTSDCTTISTIGLAESTVVLCTLYPNPASTKLTIQTDASVEGIEVYTLTGERVLATSTSTFSVDHLASGTYLIKLMTDQGTLQRRFIKE